MHASPGFAVRFGCTTDSLNNSYNFLSRIGKVVLRIRPRFYVLRVSFQDSWISFFFPQKFRRVIESRICVRYSLVRKSSLKAPAGPIIR